MGYPRITPRDLFNDANLLKCYGKISLLILDRDIDWLEEEIDFSYCDHFDITQDSADGSTFVSNVRYKIKGTSQYLSLSRPLNSRKSWSLWAHGDDNDYEVFDEKGNFILKRDDLRKESEYVISSHDERNLKELRDNNAHSEIRVIIATIFQKHHEFIGSEFDKYLIFFDRLNAKHEQKGYMSNAMIKARHKATDLMLADIEEHHGKWNRDRAYNCM